MTVSKRTSATTKSREVADAAKKRNPTATRFETRRNTLYPVKSKVTAPVRDVVGNVLNQSESDARASKSNTRRVHTNARRGANASGTEKRVASISIRDVAAKSKAAADFLIRLRNEHSRMAQIAKTRERQLAVLRREGPEPTWLGIGARTPFETDVIQKRYIQNLFVESEYRISLGDEYQPANANIVNIAATFHLGITDIDTRGILLFENGIEGYYGTRRFPACNVYLSLEMYGKVLSVRMFQSGKVSITGAKSRHEALHGAHLFVNYLRRHEIDCSVLDFQIRNVVLVFNAGHRIDIDEMSAAFPKLMPSGDSASMLDASMPYRVDRQPYLDDIDSLVYPTHKRATSNASNYNNVIPLLLTGPESFSALTSFQRASAAPEEPWSDDPRDAGLPCPTIVRNIEFSALILRINPDKPPAVLVNPSGTGVLCGAASIDAATDFIRRAIRIMNRFKASDQPKNSVFFDTETQNNASLSGFGVSSIVAQIAAFAAPGADTARTQKFSKYDFDVDNDDEGEDEVARAIRIRKEAELMADIFGDKGENLLGTCLDEIVHHEVVNQGYSGLILMDENENADAQ